MCRHIATASAAAIPAPDFAHFRAPSRLRQRAALLHVKRVVTMRSIPVFMRVMAQFSKCRTPSDLSDGLKTGAFDVHLPLGQGSFTKPHSGAIPFRWTAIEGMIQSCELPIVAGVRLTNIPRCRELAAKRLQTDCTHLHSDCSSTAKRLHIDCNRLHKLTSVQESALSLCRSKLFLQFIRNSAQHPLVIA